MKPKLLTDRLSIMGLVEGREGEGVDYSRGFLREADEKEFSFRGIESKIIRRQGLRVRFGCVPDGDGQI